MLERLASFASSKGAKQMCLSLVPSRDTDEISALQDETSAAVSRISRFGPVSFDGTDDLASVTSRLSIGAPLNGGELLSLASFLSTAESVKEYGSLARDEDQMPSRDEHGHASDPASSRAECGHANDPASSRAECGHDVENACDDVLSERFDFIDPLCDLCGHIKKCVISEDLIADDASAALKDIRREIKNTQENVRSVLQKAARKHQAFLQDSPVTMRSGRYCLPVKLEHQSEVPGIVHDRSRGGSTVFIEPDGVVRLNNLLKDLEAREQKEIARILSALSKEASDHLDEIKLDIEILTSLDFAFAKAKLSMDYDGVRPLAGRTSIRLVKARHPLLDRETVVPVDITLGEDFTMLIITGPNTGGKTVALKTLGLLQLLGQSGLHIPADPGSSIGVFKEIYADIGDEQSIEQNLSTFSAHMKNIVYFVKHARKNCLVLFDELGAGTDPGEGAALSVAVLSYLHGKGICTAATTHYSELKLFALETEGVENASCEFDIETLRPTYRFSIGTPGKSNAFLIAEKLGLPKGIIESARLKITDDEASFENVISGLDAEKKQLENERAQAEYDRRTAGEILSELEAKQAALSEKSADIIDSANRQARQILKEAKEYADKTIRDINKLSSGADMKALEKSRREVGEKIKEIPEAESSRESAGTSRMPKGIPAASLLESGGSLAPGDVVYIEPLGTFGTVASAPDRKGNLFVQAGILRSSVNINDIFVINDPGFIAGFGKEKGPAAKSDTSMKSAFISPEINVIGMRADNAIEAVDKYLDDARIANLQTVSIIHGKGTGALREAIHKFLKQNEAVKSFRGGEYGEGDAGVTIVELK